MFTESRLLYANYGSHCVCLPVILIDCIFKVDKRYSQVFLDKCKYVVKENKITKFINNKLEISSDDYDEEVSDED